MIVLPLFLVLKKLLLFLKKFVGRLVTNFASVPVSSILTGYHWRKCALFHLFFLLFGLIDICLLAFEMGLFDIVFGESVLQLFVLILELLLVALVLLVVDVVPLVLVLCKR